MSRFFALALLALTLLAVSSSSQKSRYDPLNFYKFSINAKECTDSLFTCIIEPMGYPWESHGTVTDDGYVLKLFRIQAKSGRITSGKPVVMLQHGLIDSADDWVMNDEKGSLGLILADAGYDVWLTNSRGNKYSRIGTNVTPNHKEFWDYSFQEMGQYDIKANIDFILKMTGKKKLTYVGHSQGTSQMFAALGRKETAQFVNARVNKFIALAPIVFLANSPSKLFHRISADNFFIDTAKFFNVNEWLSGACSMTSIQSEFQYAVCKVAPILCDWLIGFVDYNPKYDNNKRLPIFLQHMPAGTSLRTLLHYTQYFTQKDRSHPVFRMYDFGRTENRKRYGSDVAPDYDLSLIDIPVRGFYGIEDKLGDPFDNSILRTRLTDLGKDYKDYIYDDCGHMTFMWPADPGHIFKDVLAEIASAQ